MHIAVAGNIGSGKTTFSDLILNFYTLNQGLIAIDDINIKDINVNSLRQRISLVSQDNILFDDTIYNNIKLGNIEADDEKIYEAAKKANAYEFINKMPNKFQTNIGEKGVKISGGQKQRIAIARTLYKNPNIIFMDESTSALDEKTEELILSKLIKLYKGKTIIIVTHRPKTLNYCDKKYFLEQGNLKEIIDNEESITGNYLSGKKFIPVPKKRRTARNGRFLEILGATGNNLQNANLKIPIGTFSCVTGVSGSGKSTLVLQTLFNALNLTLNNNKSRKLPKPFKNYKGTELIDKVIDIDQSPIGRTPRSNPATYTGAFGPIRDWFSNLPESKDRKSVV